MKKVVVIDGQGGKLGKTIISLLKEKYDFRLIAIGTNSLATANMLLPGVEGATGENPVVVNCRDADIIIGPIGIVISDSLLGEVTPLMASAVGKSKAKKILIPINKCETIIAATRGISLKEVINSVLEEVDKIINN